MIDATVSARSDAVSAGRAEVEVPNVLERVVLAVKRRETREARLAYDAYERLSAFDVPKGRATDILYGSVEAAYRTLLAGAEQASSTFVYAPMVRARAARAGKRLRVLSAPYVRGHAKITIGDDCTFETFLVATGRFVDEPELSFGDGCYVAEEARFSVNRRVSIGRGVFISRRVEIADSDGHPTNVERRLRGDTLTESDIESVTIGDHAFIGPGSHVLKGVTIGRGAVVGAGSVVVSDVGDGELVIGVPARPVAGARR